MRARAAATIARVASDGPMRTMNRDSSHRSKIREAPKAGSALSASAGGPIPAHVVAPRRVDKRGLPVAAIKQTPRLDLREAVHNNQSVRS